MEFSYKYTDKGTKKKISGALEAPDINTAKAMLRNKGIRPSEIHDASKPPWKLFTKDDAGNMTLNPPPFMQGSVGLGEIVMFCKQFSVMIDAGLPLVEGLHILAGQGANKNFNFQIKKIAEHIEGGNTLAESLERFPQTFDRLFCSMVAAGEEGGILDSILKKLSDFLEKNLKLIKTVKSAMTYPIIVVAISFLVVTVIMIWVVPVFEKMFKEMGNALPWLTQQVIDMSNYFVANFVWIIGGVGMGIFGLISFKKSSKGAVLFDRYILKVPVIGDLIKAVAIARFCGTMSTMLGAGVAIIDSLEICSKTAGNITLEREIMTMQGAVMEGATITSVLEKSKLFPKLVASMIGVGEEAGNMDTMMEKIAIYYEDVVDESVKAMTSMIEPIMIVFLGGLIGTLVIAMYLPIFEMASNF